MFKFKRIVIGILAVVLSSSMLLGCSFFSHDNERDMQQKIAYVKSYDIVNSISVDNADGSVGTEVVTFKTQERNIYKMDLVEYVNSNASNLSSSFGTDYEGLYKYAASMLINIELVANEVDALKDPACGKIKWGLTEQNAIKRNIYSVIDSTLMSIKNEILTDRDMEQIVGDGDETDVDSETTYPVKPETTDPDAEDAEDTEVWEPDIIRQPGNHGTEDERSLDREAMRRFVALIKSRVADDFRITGEERKNIDAEIKAIDEWIDRKGITSIYPVIGTYPTTSDSPFGYIMYYLSGKSVERSQKISALQDYLSDSVTVDPSEVNDSFTTTLNDQKAKYTADVSAFNTDISGGSTTILYYPNTNYFYVKHILLPFSDDQKAALTAFSSSKEIASLQDDEKKERVNAERARLAEAIVAYPHKDGEDDKTRPMSVSSIMNHVKSVMQPLESNIARADVAFDDMIYLYNTDPGAFDNNKGYVVKYKLDEGESETYMQEFADAARKMRDELAPGQVLYEPVITDYGVHIMYLASIPRIGAVSINDYTTPGMLQTYYDVFESPIRTARDNAAYNTWERNVLSYNYNNNSEMYEDAFKNLWED